MFVSELLRQINTRLRHTTMIVGSAIKCPTFEQYLPHLTRLILLEKMYKVFDCKEAVYLPHTRL